MGCIVALLFAQDANAQDFELRGADLRVVGDAQWTGGGWGGYHPIRLEITNFGPGRDLELRFEPHDRGEGVPTVLRRVRVEQNATARVTLGVPLVGGRNSGRLGVLIDGVPVQTLRRDLTLAGPAEGESPRPSLLIISRDAVSDHGFQTAAFTDAQVWTDPAYPPGHFMTARVAAGEARSAVVDPSLLPASWIDYTAVDLVAIRLDTLAALRPDERTALLDWTAAGGRLVVHGVGSAPEESEELRRVLGRSAAREEEAPWQPAQASGRQPLPIDLVTGGGEAFVPSEGNPLPVIPGLPPEVGQLLERFGEGRAVPNPAQNALPTWEIEPAPFSVRRIGFGRIAAVSGDVFAASGADWAWLLRDLGGTAIPWPVRHGMMSGGGDLEFINLPIPGVRGVPTAAFLTLITLFTLAIGPANYFLLWRRKRLSRLVVTVPALAAATSVVLFAYAAVAHGFSTKGRVRSVTLIDPATNTATSVGRLSLFSGLAPSDGLRFSKETAVYPLYPFEEGFTDGEVDWTETQALTAGWLKTRTRTQFVTLTRRDERGRLTVTPTDGGLRVVNGFSVPFEHLVVTGPDGRAYVGRDIAAGGEAVLVPLTDERWSEIRELALDLLPEPPDGVEPQEIAAGFGGGMPWMWYRQTWQPQFRHGLLERHLARLVAQAPGGAKPPADPSNVSIDPNDPARVDLAVADDTIDPLAQPRGFLAVAGKNPGIDLGGLEVDERGSLHVVMGTW